jgi:hypothetical protein
MLNALRTAATASKSSRYSARRGGKQEERLYKQISRRVSLR